VAWLIALATFAGYTTISVFRYLRLDPGSWDLGIYTQYVGQIAHLHAPVVTIRGPGFNLLGDHFQPIVALVAPFFRLSPTPVTLLIAQALLTAVSVVPVCRAAQARLGTGVSRVIGAAYGFSWGLQQMIIFDFHEIAALHPVRRHRQRLPAGAHRPPRLPRSALSQRDLPDDLRGGQCLRLPPYHERPEAELGVGTTPSGAPRPPWILASR
jgi:hypothetical protein